MKVLSLKSRPGEPRYCQSLQVNHWFWERGYEVIPFAREELLSGSLDHYLHDEREDTIVYGTQPIGFGMDWGVTDLGQTLLVEVNDGFALGNYGTKGHHYTALIECRWRELMGLPDMELGGSDAWYGTSSLR